uniref:Lipocalin n=1 Tax=Rhipicephalus zambeziensis TaxID=60191 RepID=A0A224YBX1_9ACAR
MVGKNILLLANMFQVFACVSSTDVRTPPMPGNVEELREALNTDDKIWLYKRRTKKPNENHTCLFWQKKELSDTEYKFTEAYWASNKPHMKDLTGKIIKSPQIDLEGAILNVTGNSEEGTDLEYLLVQWYLEHHCAIFYTQKEHKGKREKQTCGLYYWTISVDDKEDQRQCDGYYATYCDTYGYEDQIVYNSSCRSLPGC